MTGGQLGPSGDLNALMTALARKGRLLRYPPAQRRRAVDGCDYAACWQPATHLVDGWGFCGAHRREHELLRREGAA